MVACRLWFSSVLSEQSGHASPLRFATSLRRAGRASLIAESRWFKGCIFEGWERSVHSYQGLAVRPSSPV
ncbi:hypothetical protein NDU88_006218 [Pleurodeles waltl]|uniref:Secreted protein n=1 Tax=Pleurodeles waltl TaxID=8319 RepID=A0AAV7QL42_PLEWA|nr:hypothetical protein NDU88_006218 [Pleurodeles waltl]